MSNALTGDFDVVVEASVPAVNRVLAVQHQATTFLHSFTLRIQDIAPVSAPALSSARLSVEEARRQTDADASVPSPGHLERAVPQAGGGNGNFTGIYGFAEIQVSTPTITLPQDPNASRVTIHYQIMAHFIAVPPSTPMPEFLHGELQATVDVVQVTSQMGNVVEIDFTKGDFTVNFIPFFADPPLSPLQNSQINQLIHNILSAKFQPVNARLPDSIQLIKFKTLSNVPQPAAALLLDLRADAPPNPDPGSVTRGLLNADDQFAVAAGRDFVVATLEKAFENANHDFPISFDIHLLFFTITVRYDIHLNNIHIDLQPGQIVLTINGRATSRTFPFPSFNFQVRQAVTLSIQNGQVVLSASGNPDVSAPGIVGLVIQLFKGAVIGKLKNLLGQVLSQAQPLVQQALDSNKNLGAVLQTLKIPAQLTYTSIEIQTDGLILHGTLDVPNFEAPHVEFSSNIVTVNGVTQLQFNALSTWIPGGTIVQYGWTGPGEPPMVIIEPHRFITRVPLGNDPAQWCLSLAGTQITAQGTPTERGVSGLSPSCTIIIFSPGLLRAEDTLLKKLTVALPGHPTIDRSSESVADVAPWASGNTTFNSGMNMIVYFADSQIGENLAEIREALFASSKQDSAVLVVAVLPPEHEKVKPIDFGPNAVLALTEDAEGGWRQAFGVKELPTTYLVTPDGQIAWQHTGQLDEAELTAAFDQYLVPGGRLLSEQLRLAAQVDESAPDFLFEYVPGREIALRRLSGRRALLTFWTSWSKASLEELRNLEKLQDTASQRDLVILAINDGENPEYAREVFKENGFTSQLVTDPNRQISQLYGVNCWPTTVSINEDGLVSGIQFGLTPAREDVVLTSQSRNIGS